MNKHKQTQKPAPKQDAAPAPQPQQEPAGAAQPQPAPQAGAAPVNAAMQVVYKAGKPYNVRTGTAQDNARSWEAIQKVLQEKGGQASRADLVAAVTSYNHAPFVGYAIRRGWLMVATQPAASTQAA